MKKYTNQSIHKLIEKQKSYRNYLKTISMNKLEPNKNFLEEDKKVTIAEYEEQMFHIPNKEYLNSIDPKELEEAKKMFSNFKNVPDIENIFNDFNERLTKDNN